MTELSRVDAEVGGGGGQGTEGQWKGGDGGRGGGGGEEGAARKRPRTQQQKEGSEGGRAGKRGGGNLWPRWIYGVRFSGMLGGAFPARAATGCLAPNPRKAKPYSSGPPGQDGQEQASRQRGFRELVLLYRFKVQHKV